MLIICLHDIIVHLFDSLRYLNLLMPLTGINPGKSHGQGPWVSHERHRLDDSSCANRRRRSCSILLLVDAITGEGQGWCARLGLHILYWMISVSPLLALIYEAKSQGARLGLH